MLLVELKRLRKDAGPAAEFLRSILEENPRSHGSKLEFTKTRAKDVKQLLHKFLHDRKLENYRIVTVGSNLVEVIEPKKENLHVKHSKRVRPARRVKAGALTIPQYWVAAATGGPMPGLERK